MIRPVAALILLTAQSPVDFSGLRDPAPATRVNTLLALRKAQGAHPELMEPVAQALEDDTLEVRTAAAYTLAQLAVGLGCKPVDFLAWQVFKPLFERVPVRQSKLAIRYPETAKNARVQGRVLAQFLVLEDGSIGELTLISGRPILADPVLKELQGQRYEPARRNGRAVPFAYVFEVSFRLF